MNVDPVGMIGMKDKARTFLGTIDLDNCSRKYHNQVLYEMACIFRSMRSINNKKVLIN